MLYGKAARCEFILALALIIGLALLGSLPIPAQAQGSIIDLEIGGEGATSWNIGKIEPGDTGTKTVELHNAGSRNGFVTIWISDIEEVDHGGDGAVLDDYLLLDLSCDRLTSKIDLPTTIHNFPKAASDRSLLVTPLNVGETVTLEWKWGLPWETGNDAQGDSFSFTINYMLEELLPHGGGGGGGGGGGSPQEPGRLELQVDIEGKVTSGGRTEEGVLTETIDAASADAVLILLLPQGTTVLDCVGNPLDRIDVDYVTPAEPPPDTWLMGSGYDLKPCCTFDPPITFIMHYDQQAPGDGIDEDNLVIAYYDPSEQEWVVLPSVVDTEAQMVTASVGHSSTFALLALALEVTPTPTPTPTPIPTPVSGLATGGWIVGIGAGILLLLGFIVWLTKRRGRGTGFKIDSGEAQARIVQL